MLERFSLGTGDRFGQQGKAQLGAIQKALQEHDILITPVWNKSHREHEIIGTGPQDVRAEADESTNELGWDKRYFVDADHITQKIVDPYIECSNFFTLDVANYIGEKADEEFRQAFMQANSNHIGEVNIPEIAEAFTVTKDFLYQWVDQYLSAIEKAGELYRYIDERKTNGEAVFEISMDEVDTPQTPIELFFILKTVAEHGIPINTIAPKFTGDFYKGIDYVGDIEQFTKEFEQDLLVIAHTVEAFGLPEDLKLSVHSGSDKFSLYPHIHSLLLKHNAGVHLKTSGTTWLEELIGLAIAGGEALDLAKSIYKQAFSQREELTKPYATVVDIQEDDLPLPKDVAFWSSSQYVNALRHDQENPAYNLSFRQLLHCAYKIAAEEGASFIDALQKFEPKIATTVTGNLYNRHIKPLFIGDLKKD